MQDDSLQDVRASSRWGKPALVILVLLLILAAFPFAVRTLVLSRVPDRGNPFDPTLLDALDVRIDENAYTYYRQASDLLVDHPSDVHQLYSGGAGEFGDLVVRCYTDGWQHADEHVRAQLEVNRPALEAWRLGAGQQKARYHDPRDVTFNTPLPVDQNLRDLTRWALVEASRLAAEGEMAESWEWIHAGFRSSRHLGSYGALISRLVGVAIHAACTQTAIHWASNPQVTESELRSALHDVQESDGLTPTNVEILQTEYFLLKNSITEIYDGDFDEDLLGAEFDGGAPLKPVAYLRGEPERSLRLTDHYFANLLPHVDKPRHERPPYHPGRYNLFDDSPPSAGRAAVLPPAELDVALQEARIVRMFAPAVKQFLDTADRERARQGCLLVALAAQAYHRAHGRFPEELQEMVPDYLNEVPADPFSPTAAPLRYIREQDRLRIYSVHLNGVDDGGTDVMAQPRTQILDEGIEIQAPELPAD